MDKHVKVLIADENADFCAGLSELLQYKGHSVAGTAQDGAAALELLRRCRPDFRQMPPSSRYHGFPTGYPRHGNSSVLP